MVSFHSSVFLAMASESTGALDGLAFNSDCNEKRDLGDVPAHVSALHFSYQGCFCGVVGLALSFL